MSIKKMLGVVLSCAMVVGCVGMSAMAAESGGDLSLEVVTGGVQKDLVMEPLTAGSGGIVQAMNIAPQVEKEVVNIEDLPSMNLDTSEVETFDLEDVNPLATGFINEDIPANGSITATDPFNLEAGETVTLNCTYSPADANVLFGLLAPDGGYYYFDVTGGNIQETVKVNMRGAYTLHIINNSDTLVTVMGSVSY